MTTTRSSLCAASSPATTAPAVPPPSTTVSAWRGTLTRCRSLMPRYRSSTRRFSSGWSRQAPQDRLQDASVVEVFDFDRAVDPYDRLELDDIPSWPRRFDLHPLPRCDLLQAENIKGLLAGQTKRGRVLTRQELQWQDAHANQVGAVDALETLDQDRLHSEQQRSLGGPVARGAGAVLLASDYDEGSILGDVAHRRVVDTHLLAAGEMDGPVPLFAAHELIAQPDVGERSPDHHLMVPATRAVGVELVWGHAVLDQVAAGRAVLGDASRGGDVIGRDRVPQQRQHPCVVDVARRRWLIGDGLKEGRVLDVGGVLA